MGKEKQGRGRLWDGEREIIVLSWVVRLGLPEKAAFEERPKGVRSQPYGVWEKAFPG